MLSVVLVTVLVGLAMAGLEPTLETTANKIHNSQDKIQDEILQAMKDSGVLAEWKTQLDEMLYEEQETETGEVKERSMFNQQEKDMISSFLSEYVLEKRLLVSPDLILRILERVQKTPSPNLPQLFVQLSPLIDVVSAIAAKSPDKVEAIVERQAPVFDSPAKTKDILHTLTENLKSELVRLTLDTAKPPPPAAPKKKAATPAPSGGKKKKQEKKSGGGLDIADYLTLGSTLLKGGNAAQLMSLLSGESDMSSLLTLLPQLIESGNYKDILSKMFNSYMEGSPYAMVYQQFTQNLLSNDQGKTFVESAFSYLENFIKSETGRRLTGVIPRLVAAKDLEKMLEIVHVESEWYWGQFFSSIQNTDYKEKFMGQLSEYMVNAYEFFEKPPKGSTLARAPTLINGFLISNRIPAFDTNNPVESLITMLNKSIKLFTTWKFDVTEYVRDIAKAAQQAYSKQAKGNSFAGLNHVERTALLGRLIDQELVEPFQAVWTVYTHSVSNRDCIQHLLCLVNSHEAKSGQGEARLAVSKFASLAAAWALAQGQGLEVGNQYWQLYRQAVWSGANGADCRLSFPHAARSTCTVFPWQTPKKNLMSTEYEHVEL